MIMFTALLYSLRTHDTKGSWGWREKHIKGQCWPKGLRSKPVTPTQVPGPVGQTWVGRWKAALFPPFLVATTECPWARPLTPTAQTVVVLSSFQVCNSVNVIRAFLQNLSNHQNIFFFLATNHRYADTLHSSVGLMYGQYCVYDLVRFRVFKTSHGLLKNIS